MKLSYSILLYLCLPFYLFGTEYPDISVKELQSAIKQGNVAVIDVNGARSFSNGHIPTAIDFSTDGKKLVLSCRRTKIHLLSHTVAGLDAGLISEERMPQLSLVTKR